ncbi:hypothetical protein RFI_27970 [Reticulomyxa filosa]|uniref:Uncharacterized protein n=1 Tax=Reticulomyxa filosa TaxID=46433 RepID=X6M8S3_RETFI|nr:hypothetical protein RFI_27970 [Reticulomyxa filosa]|eukprot:ETO09410.1 hypothetical protein RFI_27970 [Reticulomyxa filosa]
MVERAFSRYNTGVLCLQFPDGHVEAFGALPQGYSQGFSLQKEDKRVKCSNTMIIKNVDETFTALSYGNTITMGEAYFRGHWSVDVTKQDLGDLLTQLFWNSVTNEHPIQKWLKYVSIWDWQQYLERIGLRKDAAEDAKNVNETYFGTDFFQHILDDSLTYRTFLLHKQGSKLLL